MVLPRSSYNSAEPHRSSGPIARLVLLVATALVIAACASYEKRVDLTYRRGPQGDRGSGEVFLAKTVVEDRLPKLPGGRVVLGTVKDSVTQIVTLDDVNRWSRAR